MLQYILVCAIVFVSDQQHQSVVVSIHVAWSDSEDIHAFTQSKLCQAMLVVDAFHSTAQQHMLISGKTARRLIQAMV